MPLAPAQLFTNCSRPVQWQKDARCWRAYASDGAVAVARLSQPRSLAEFLAMPDDDHDVPTEPSAPASAGAAAAMSTEPQALAETQKSPLLRHSRLQTNCLRVTQRVRDKATAGSVRMKKHRRTKKHWRTKLHCLRSRTQHHSSSQPRGEAPASQERAGMAAEPATEPAEGPSGHAPELGAQSRQSSGYCPQAGTPVVIAA